jgi:hypothetical protein
MTLCLKVLHDLLRDDLGRQGLVRVTEGGIAQPGDVQVGLVAGHDLVV